jgi:hypothetical protein
MHDYRRRMYPCVLVGKNGGRHMGDARFHLLDIETFIFNKNI